MKKLPLDCKFILKVTATSPTPIILKQSIETFLNDTVLPLLPELLAGNEDMKVELDIEEKK